MAFGEHLNSDLLGSSYVLCNGIDLIKMGGILFRDFLPFIAEDFTRWMRGGPHFAIQSDLPRCTATPY